MKKLLTLAVLSVSAAAMADPWSVVGAGGSVPDNNAGGFTSSANFTGAAGSITGITSVTLQTFSHTWVGDLTIWLEHGANRFTLMQRPRGDATATSTVGDSSNMLGTYTFDVVSATTIEQAAATSNLTTHNILAGSYRAAHQTNELATTVGLNDVLSDGSVFNGMDPNGTWTLRITDGAAGDLGTLQGWSAEGTYTAVPEPASMAALGLGVAALLRRRRK